MKSVMDVLGYHDCSVGDNMGLVHYEMNEEEVKILPQHVPGNSTYESYKNMASDRFWSTVLLLNSDNSRFGGLKKDLANSYAKGKNKYPSTLTASYKILLKYKEIDDS